MLVYGVTTFTVGLIWVSYLKLTKQPLLITQPGLLYSLGTNLLHLQVESKTEKEIEQRLFDLEDDDFHVREMARWKLASIGSEAVPALLHQLKTDKQHCRWEAAKILGEIRDELAAEALVEALLDESVNVHWAASESLIKYGQDAILPLLEGIIRHFDSMRFRQGAFHILHALESSHMLEPKVQEVLDALGNIEPSASAPWAAERAIEYFKFQQKQEQLE